MKVCVYGLWHLGSVTAASLAAKGIHTIGLEDDRATVEKLNCGQAPLFEPGLDTLLMAGIEANTLSFTCDVAAGVADADIVWVTFDTPVDDDDHADVDHVVSRIATLFPYLRDGSVLLVSSQMPVGTTAELERRFSTTAGSRAVHMAYTPENLRLGKAIEVFNDPGRIIIGTRDAATRPLLEPLLKSFCSNLIWISVEAAEMTKHAINAYLATCVTFINEIATICERVGADASEVERALRSEPRIGEKAYIRPGAAFAGGTLARDVVFLNELAACSNLSLPLLGSILPSNQRHSAWPLHQVESRLGNLQGHTVAVLGLSYKPGTDAIRRSNAIEVIRGLLAGGAKVQAFDPQVHKLPDEFSSVYLAASALAAAKGASCLIVATEWPEFRELGVQELLDQLSRPLIIDQNQFLDRNIGTDPRIDLVTIGKRS